MRCAGHVVTGGAGGGAGQMHTGFWWGKLREIDPVEDLGLDGRIILKLILKKWDGEIQWIDLAQKGNRWRAFLNAVLNLRVSQNAGNFLTS
jgi:hypothetical protein